MARRTQVLTIEEKDSRDAGKSYQITEMAAEQAEWWAFRALQGILGGDSDVNFNAPLAQLAGQAFRAMAGIPPERARPLMDEMMACVQVKLPSNGGTRDLLDGDVEEVSTRMQLRRAVFELHTGFSLRGSEQES
jgi:hypothetical protein